MKQFLKTHIYTILQSSIFIIYFWFGILKVLFISPASPLVDALLQKTLPFLTFEQFIIPFGIFEMVIGLCFLIPKLNKLGFLLIIPHLITTAMPLILLPSITWQGIFIPTMEGQYIIKNILIIVIIMCLSLSEKGLLSSVRK